MKKLYYFFLLIFSFSLGFSQTAFWTETFGTGCNQNTYANGFSSGPNGPWSVTHLPGYTPTPPPNNSGTDEWFVSATESNPGLGSCSVGCPSNPTTNQSLHISTYVTSSPLTLCPSGDCGSVYNAGYSSDLRAESPVINATGKTSYTLSFNYLLYGDASNDDGEVYYKVGAGPWTFLANPAKTSCGNGGGCTPTTCNGFLQGIWTNFSVAMPAAANNQPAVQVGFRWKNNGDNTGTDPSFAIDDVKMLSPSSYTPAFTLTSPACTGQTQTVTCTTTPATVVVAGYTWTAAPAGPTFSAPNASVTNITFPSAGTFSITVTTSVTGQGSATATQTVLVNTTPTISASANPTLMCAGSSSTLTATGATTYAWSGPSLSTAGPGSVTVATPAANSVYTVIGTTAGCADTATVQVNYSPGLTLTVSATSNNICSGASSTLSASGATNYTWSPAASLNTTSGNMVVASPTTSTTYTVVGSTGACSGQTVVSVNVSGGLSITPNVSSASVCPSGSVQLSASGATNYTWTPSGSLSSPTGATVTANPSTTTTYTIVGATGACTGSTTIKVSVITLSPPVITASSATTCVGGTPVTFQATGFTNYIWTPTVSLFPTSGAVVVASPTTLTTYTVLGSTGTCTGQAVATVSVTPPPVLTITPTSTVICYGTSYTFAASGAFTYTWTPPSAGGNAYITPIDTNYQQVVLNPTVSTVYTVSAQSSLGCTAITKTVSLGVAPIPTATLSLNTGVAGTNSLCASGTPTSGAPIPATATLNLNTSALPTGVGNFMYQWTPTTSLNPTTGTTTAAYMTMPWCGTDYLRTYTATVFYEFLPNCRAKDTATIRVVNCWPPQAKISASNNNGKDTLCEKGCTVLQNITCGGGPMSAHWSVGGATFQGGGTDSISTYLQPITVCFPVAPYTYSVGLIVNTPYGSDTAIKYNYIHVVDTPDAVRASAHPIAIRDTCIRYGKQIQLHTLFPGPHTYVEWFPKPSLDQPYSQTPIASPTVTTVYILKAYNSKKCYYNDTVTVCVVPDCGEMYVPNAFSPNNDGKNDILYVRGKCLTNIQFQIFNRWGEKVFESHDQENGWDGTYNGEIMNTGVFVYRLEGTTISNEPYSMKGNITLIR